MRTNRKTYGDRKGNREKFPSEHDSVITLNAISKSHKYFKHIAQLNFKQQLAIS